MHEWEAGSPLPATALTAHMNRFLEWEAVRGMGARTTTSRVHALGRFIRWCDERGVGDPRAVTRPMLERYQKHLHYYRKSTGEPLAIASQRALLTPLKAFFRWLVRENYILYNPASDLELPRVPPAVPKVILSVVEVERVLSVIDTAMPGGVRDRALLETLYSTGVRRMELVNLRLYDVDLARKTLWVRAGKGGKDRLLPVGDRAVYWLERYQREVRSTLVAGGDEGHLFLTDYGEPLLHRRLADRVEKYLRLAGVEKQGASHLFRHAMATHMLDNGADIRFIQAMLGHSNLSTTQIYTQVSIEKLREIHAATHPAKVRDREVLRALLAADGEGDGGEE